MKETIIAHTELGQRVLIVCMKALFDNRNVPDWPERDERFDTPDVYLREYGWELEGRKLCATHWGGFGIGANTLSFGVYHQGVASRSSVPNRSPSDILPPHNWAEGGGRHDGRRICP
jgi:hypothetical protein